MVNRPPECDNTSSGIHAIDADGDRGLRYR